MMFTIKPRPLHIIKKSLATSVSNVTAPGQRSHESFESYRLVRRNCGDGEEAPCGVHLVLSSGDKIQFRFLCFSQSKSAYRCLACTVRTRRRRLWYLQPPEGRRSSLTPVSSPHLLAIRFALGIFPPLFSWTHHGDLACLKYQQAQQLPFCPWRCIRYYWRNVRGQPYLPSVTGPWTASCRPHSCGGLISLPSSTPHKSRTSL